MSRLEETALKTLAGDVAEELPERIAEELPARLGYLAEVLSEISQAHREGSAGKVTPELWGVKGWLKKRAEKWVKDRAAALAEELADELAWVLSDELPDDGSCETLRGMLTEKERVKGMEGLTEKLAMKLAVEWLTENGDPVEEARVLAEELPKPFAEEFEDVWWLGDRRFERRS